MKNREDEALPLRRSGGDQKASVDSSVDAARESGYATVPITLPKVLTMPFATQPRSMW